ncbi:MAG: S8 family serine peptidase [Candidatus Dormibacteraeota bacterium]|nr:S8 family serine peptidase [Candidatus Dormibacteraeota bacterium]
MTRTFFGLRARVVARFGALAGTAALVVGLTPATSTIGAAAATTQRTYLVLAKQENVSARLLSQLRAQGGTIVASYDAIGVVVVRTGDAQFAGRAQKNLDVEGTADASKLTFKVKPSIENNGGDHDGNGNKPASDSDNLSGLQWDMRQIKTPQAHQITGGSRSVLVGDIDTGLDYTHPDLAPNVDSAKSVNCLTGSPVAGAAAAMDDNGHGTHTAGTIAAAANGIGIVGVAPNVRIAGIKAGDSQGFFFPQAVVCAFMWAGSHHFNVTNNSYFADPYYFNCPNGTQEERVILKSEGRAIAYATRKGVTNIAAAGNFSDDMANPTQDRQSPDDRPPQPPAPRPVTKACKVIPVQMPGVIGVSATGNLNMKSFYSNYGMGVIHVAAPGGDSRLQRTAAAPNGRVLSTYPVSLKNGCLRPVVDPAGGPKAFYCYLQGTSMASPHVTGLAALIISQFGEMSPSDVRQRLEQTADPIACPTAAQLALYAPYPSANNDAPQTCTGPTSHNSWYGFGQVNALKAISGEGDDDQNNQNN